VRNNDVSEEIVLAEANLVLLFPDLLRPLDEAERDGLEASIQQNGILAPVVVDEDNAVIDGGHRLGIARRLGMVSIPIQRLCGLSSDQKRDLALSMNLDRRHLSQTVLQHLRQERIARVAEKRQEGNSTRAIAEEEGVSQPQILRDLKAATDTGVSVQPEGGKVLGLDGKKRPATITSGKGPAGAAAPGESASLFCPECSRNSPVKNCSACREIRQGIPQREAGDDEEAIQEDERQRKEEAASVPGQK
jgi:hypothetical protein